MKSTTIIVFLISVVVARHNHRTFLKSLLKSKGNLYTKVDNDVQNVMNNLFDSLNLSADFITKSRVKLLLTMHYDLKSVAEKNYDIYANMQEAAKIDNNGNKTESAMELFELIEDLLDDTLNYSATFRAHKKLRKHAKHKTTTVADLTSTETMTAPQNLSEPVFADSKEFEQFIHDFVKKVDNISEKDFVRSPTPPDEEDVIDEPSFDLWKPPAVLELDHVNDSYTRRIFSGKRTRIKSYPFLVSVHLMEAFVCAGSILSKNLVITAASCLQLLYNNRFYRENPRAVSVRIGSDYFAISGEKIYIVEVFFHHAYDPKTLNNNLVLLRLYRDIRFRRKQKRVKRISYDRSNANLASDTDKIIIVGWGGRKITNKIDEFERMMVSQLGIYEVNECADIYSKKFVTHKHFCAGYISSGGGACNKDVGGPGIVNGVLVGVISFGPPVCGAIDSPTVFTKLGHYAPWIDSIMQTPSARIRAQTTLLYRNTVPRPIPYIMKVTKTLIAPIVPSTHSPEMLGENVQKLKAVLGEIVRADPAYFQDILYYDFTESDFLDMFKTSPTTFDPLQHPLANKSFFAIPEIHTLETTSKYATIPLTTSSTLLPIPPQLTDPVGPTTQPPSRTPASTMEDHITDLETAIPDETFEHITHTITHETTTVLSVEMLRDRYASYEERTAAEHWVEPTYHHLHKHHAKRYHHSKKHISKKYKKPKYLYEQ